MIRFEYDITKHPAEEFNKLIYFCSDEGECALRELPPDQLRVLVVKKVLRQEHIDSGLVTLVDATTAQFFFSPEHRKRIGRNLAPPYMRSPDTIPS